MTDVNNLDCNHWGGTDFTAPGVPPAAAAALVILLNRLGNDIERRDGDAAVRTIDAISIVAGRDYAQRLTNHLIARALHRLHAGGDA